MKNQNGNIMKNVIKWGRYNLYMVPLSLILFLGPVLCGACDDADLARSANGLWYLKLNMKDEYGIPYTENQYLQFNFKESDEKDGGTFRETFQMDQTEETDGLQVTYKVQSTIHGDWEVLLEDLYMTYDVFFGSENK